MTEGLRRRYSPHTVTAIILCFDNPTVLFAVRSQSTSPSKEVEAYVTLPQNGSGNPLPYDNRTKNPYPPQRKENP